MKYTETKKLIESLFMRLGVYTTDARNITLMVLASGKQLDYNTFNEILSNSGKIGSFLKKVGHDQTEILFSQVKNDLSLTVIFIRALIDMQGMAHLPVTPKAQAEFCSIMLGAADYLSSFEGWRNE
jgi:hypothetical protein